MPMGKVYISGIVDAEPIGSAVPPGVPTHPIAPGGPPPGYWGGVAPPQPTHPIAPGGPPPGYWGGVAPPWVSHPIAPGGPEVTHPIAPGGPPLGIWGGGNVPMPSPPIYIPIDPPPGIPGLKPDHPIYIPVYPSHPIVLPPGTPPNSEEIREKIKAFLFGNLPPSPPHPEPV